MCPSCLRPLEKRDGYVLEGLREASLKGPGGPGKVSVKGRLQMVSRERGVGGTW